MNENIPEIYPRPIELLAPARDALTAMAAIDHGADAVYMGAPSFGARAQAGNSLDDIGRVARYAHQFNARLYVTVNTIIFDHELNKARALVWDLWRAGVDAVIVQDLALTRMHLPPIALHASTQCDTRTPAKARFLHDCGFTRIVLARELTREEISEIHREVDADLEVFVHGALCVSFSGDCQASAALTGRSANRGECAQICRYKFDLEDEYGNKIISGKHLLSLRDMNRLGNLEELLEAGVSSLKIEGRLKDMAYVKNVVAAYRRKLDAVIAARPDRYCRSSVGRSAVTFNADPAESFNRGFTDYFFTGATPKKNSLATFDSPKWVGLPVGRVKKVAGKCIVADLKTALSNGDGLGFFSPDGEFIGFRLNRVDGERLFPATAVNPRPGTTLYRNSDKSRGDLLAGNTAVRRIGLFMKLYWTPGQLVLNLKSEDGAEVTVADAVEYQQARSSQTERRRKELEKLGDTIYRASDIEDAAGDSFIPASALASLRRRGVAMLDVARVCAYRSEKPGRPADKISLPEGYVVSRHDNIANHLAAEFYSELSGIAAEKLPQALETDIPKGIAADRRIMETRYCLRCELGACLKKAGEGKTLPSPLFLTSGNSRLRLEFDCRNCRMSVLLS